MKKPVPSDNTYVSVEGVLAEVDTDSNSRVVRFVVCVDNINFLGKAPASASLTGSVGEHCRSLLSRPMHRTVPLQLLLLLHPPPTGNTNSPHPTPGLGFLHLQLLLLLCPVFIFVPRVDLS
jgi:hypothetical protein